MNEGPSAGAILLAIFLILFGLCFTLLGGGCTLFWIWAMFQGPGTTIGAGPFVILALMTLGVGLLLLWVSVKLLRGNSGPAPVSSTPPPVQGTEAPPPTSEP